MARNKRKSPTATLKAKLKAQLAAPLTQARQRLKSSSRAIRTTTPPAKTRTAVSPRAATRPAAKIAKTPRRLPRMAPSQRLPRKATRYTTARPTLGAPAVGTTGVPNVALPLATASPAAHAAWSPQPAATGPMLPQRYGTTKLVLLVRDPW